MIPIIGHQTGPYTPQCPIISPDQISNRHICDISELTEQLPQIFPFDAKYHITTARELTMITFTEPTQIGIFIPDHLLNTQENDALLQYINDTYCKESPNFDVEPINALIASNYMQYILLNPVQKYLHTLRRLYRREPPVWSVCDKANDFIIGIYCAFKRNY